MHSLTLGSGAEILCSQTVQWHKVQCGKTYLRIHTDSDSDLVIFITIHYFTEQFAYLVAFHQIERCVDRLYAILFVWSLLCPGIKGRRSDKCGQVYGCGKYLYGAVLLLYSHLPNSSSPGTIMIAYPVPPPPSITNCSRISLSEWLEVTSAARDSIKGRPANVKSMAWAVGPYPF